MAVDIRRLESLLMKLRPVNDSKFNFTNNYFLTKNN